MGAVHVCALCVYVSTCHVCLHKSMMLIYGCLLSCSIASPEGGSRPQHSYFFWGILATPGIIIITKINVAAKPQGFLTR